MSEYEESENLGGAGMRPPHFFDSGTEEICADKAPNIAFTMRNSGWLYSDIYIYTREKIQQGWKEKGAPFRGGGAKRQIQGVPNREKVVAQKDGNKVVTAVVLRRNGGVFSIKIFTLC